MRWENNHFVKIFELHIRKYLYKMYTVYRRFAYLSGIQTNIFEIILVIIFSVLYSLPIYTILIINEFYNIAYIVFMHLKSSLYHYRSVKLIVIWDCRKGHNYLTVNRAANIAYCEIVYLLV